MKKNHLLQLALIFSLIIYACDPPKEEGSTIVPLLPGADLMLSSQVVDAEEGGILSFPSGTKLEVPANAFVDAQGNPITGKVEIAYREFHDAGTILASGIPMHFNNNGKTEHFVTAGMFEMRGYTQAVAQMQIGGGTAERQEVFIAEGKAITSKMASFASDDDGLDYRFYFFNEETGQWEPRGESTATVNQQKLDALNAEAPLEEEPLKPEAFDKNMPVVDLDANTSQFPELKAFKGLLWQYAGTDESQNPHAPQNVKKLATTEWDNIDLQPTSKPGVYQAIFSSSKDNAKFVTELKPVFRGKNYDKALAKFEKKLEKFQKARQKRMAAEERRALEGNFIREATVNQFGIYNHDAFWNRQDLVVCNATFSTSESQLSDEPVYMLTEDNRGLVRYDPKEWATLRYTPKDAVFVAILDNNRIAVISREEVAEIGMPEESQNFELEIVEGINGSEELSASIQKLW